MAWLVHQLEAGPAQYTDNMPCWRGTVRGTARRPDYVLSFGRLNYKNIYFPILGVELFSKTSRRFYQTS
jgi:hypothetical protein